MLSLYLTTKNLVSTIREDGAGYRNGWTSKSVGDVRKEDSPLVVDRLDDESQRGTNLRDILPHNPLHNRRLPRIVEPPASVSPRLTPSSSSISHISYASHTFPSNPISHTHFQDKMFLGDG